MAVDPRRRSGPAAPAGPLLAVDGHPAQPDDRARRLLLLILIVMADLRAGHRHPTIP
jgi:hypothetical protein